MASKVRIVINDRAVQQLLKSPEIQKDLEERAQRIAAAAGEGMEVQMFVGSKRARATVRTATPQARHREATQRSLSSSLDAGRG